MSHQIYVREVVLTIAHPLPSCKSKKKKQSMPMTISAMRLIWGTILEQGTTLEITLVRILVSRNGHLSAGDAFAARTCCTAAEIEGGVPWA